MPVGLKSPQNPASSVAGPPNYSDVPVVGIEVDYARSDHSHGLPAATGGSGTPSGTVSGPAAFGSSPVVGVQNTFSRGDHSHGNPSESFIPAASASVAGPPAYGDAKVVGVATTYSRGDHSHGLPNGSGSPASTVTGPDAYGASPVVGTSGLFARGDHDHGLPAAFDPTAINAAIVNLQSRVSVLEGSSAPVIGIFPGTLYTNSQAGFQAALADMTIDQLRITAGTYTGWNLGVGGAGLFHVSRAARPLLVRPDTGAAVIWDGTGDNGVDGWFHFGDWSAGGSTITDYITFDSAGSGGSFTLKNYHLGQQGLIVCEWVDHCAFNNFIVTNCDHAGTGGSQATAWCIYLSNDGNVAHRGTNLAFNNWNITIAAQAMGGFQAYHPAGGLPSGVQLHGWTIHNPWVAMLAWNDITGVDMQNWTVTGAGYVVDTDGNASGSAKNNTSTGTTVNPAGLLLAPFVDAGGNSWA